MYTTRDLAIMSGMFVRTSLGMSLPQISEVANLLMLSEKCDIDLLPELSVDLLCRDLLKGRSDEVIKAVEETAEEWFEKLLIMNQCLLRHVWPEHCRLFGEAKFELHRRTKH